MTDLQEKTREEVAERKRMDAIWWAVVLIWLGLILGAEYLDILPGIGEQKEWWPWIFIGVGPWSLVFNTYRTTSSWPDPSTWDWVWTGIFMLVALVALVDVGGEIFGAAALVVIGVILLTRALSRHE